jgi:hypothetical protein
MKEAELLATSYCCQPATLMYQSQANRKQSFTKLVDNRSWRINELHIQLLCNHFISRTKLVLTSMQKSRGRRAGGGGGGLLPAAPAVVWLGAAAAGGGEAGPRLGAPPCLLDSCRRCVEDRRRGGGSPVGRTEAEKGHPHAA